MNDLELGSTRYVDRKILTAPYNRTLTGRVTDTSTTGYTVLVDNIPYTNLLVLNAVALSINDIVHIIVPNNQDGNMFILGKLG